MNLCRYVVTQLDNILPDGYHPPAIESAVSQAESKVQSLIKSVRLEGEGWGQHEFNYLNSMHYPIFLYFLAQTLFASNDETGATKIFYLNKILNGIDLYYKITLGFPFLLGHVVGSVFCRADYGNFQVFYQNVLIGVNNNKRPRLGDGLVVFPGAKLIGNVTTGENVVISAGVTVIDKDIPANVLVFSGEKGGLVFKDLNERFSDRYFNRVSG
ncbi:MAG: hypothetical protein PHG96_01710 [Kiritimatiellae bacterium]|nr:hypothetical protein [Kiritimatiellia bacterium]